MYIHSKPKTMAQRNEMKLSIKYFKLEFHAICPWKQNKYVLEIQLIVLGSIMKANETITSHFLINQTEEN